MDCILETRDLGVRYGDFVANRNVSLCVAPNTIHALIGPNGAGKTTFFNALSGYAPVSSGSIHFMGRDITHLPRNKRPGIGMARSFQITSLLPCLTVQENLRVAAQGLHAKASFNFWGKSRQTPLACNVADQIIERLALQQQAFLPISKLSHGRQRILEVAMAMAAQPKLLLLDEPTSGMGIDDLPLMRDLLQDLSEDHTIVYVEHNMSLVMSLSHKVTVLCQGEILLEGSPETIRQNESVRRVYLGERNHAKNG